MTPPFPLFALALTVATVSVWGTPQNPSLAEVPPVSDSVALDRSTVDRYYRPVATWSGRLILPDTREIEVEDRALLGEDWVWFEVENAPEEYRSSIGQTIKLTWRSSPWADGYTDLVTREIDFISLTSLSERRLGNVHPNRLDGRDRVGPLQSLAGARPEDDLRVKLDGDVEIVGSSAHGTILTIDREPVQVWGRSIGLVTFLYASPDGENRYVVQHYNPLTQQFNGARETVQFAPSPADGKGVEQFTPNRIEESPAGTAGWYLYGDRDESGTFVVRSLAPRALFQLEPDTTVVGTAPGLDYIRNGNWADTPERKGTIQRVSVSPDAPQPWQAGDRGLVIHTFGGYRFSDDENPKRRESGHFAYGIARVGRDPFTDELRFFVEYFQIYAHNPRSIISGRQAWHAFSGNLYRGQMPTRPVSDTIIRFDAFTEDYEFDGIVLSPLTELLVQISIVMGRYRTGDGTGFAITTPASSCVQDSNQALFITLQRIKTRVESSPDIQQWLAAHPDDPQTQRLQELFALLDDLDRKLVPFNIVRRDWQQNADRLTGLEPDADLIRNPASLVSAVLSGLSIVPRRAHDEIASVFYERGGQFWFLRTNQVGGWDDSIFPVAPTTLIH
ncbi:MAG: abortive infection protein [Cyanobacteria bacterium SID2]|nr:abortive infection protein [Cyanobacteria bacterium SID2]MBP0005762.1 abortive infection protein [Cyanobacteria bacterium SBC]